MLVGSGQLRGADSYANFQFLLCLAQRLLSAALVVDVRAGAEPLDDGAAGVAHGQCTPQVPAIDSVAGTLEPHFDVVWLAGPVGLGPALDVQATTLDTYLRERSIEHVTLLKCDAEGHDLAVLRGGAEALAQGRVDVWQFEYNARWIHARAFLRDVFELARAAPYALGKPSKAARKLPAQVRHKQRMKGLSDAGKLGLGNTAIAERLQRLRGSEIEAKMITPEVAQLAGLDPSATITKTSIERASPLGQSAPLGWLALQRAVILTFGTGELALRLVPVAFGMATVVAAVAVGRRWLSPVTAAGFVLVCAFGLWLEHYRFEVKHYTVDAFCGLMLPALAVWTTEAPDAAARTRRSSGGRPRKADWPCMARMEPPASPQTTVRRSARLSAAVVGPQLHLPVRGKTLEAAGRPPGSIP